MNLGLKALATVVTTTEMLGRVLAKAADQGSAEASWCGETHSVAHLLAQRAEWVSKTETEYGRVRKYYESKAA